MKRIFAEYPEILRKKMMTQTVSWKQKQDVRSLACFRILIGLYILYDILCLRLMVLDGRNAYVYSLLWYSQEGYLHPEDTPHKSPIHRLWFSRKYDPSLFFALTIILTTFYTVGYKMSSAKMKFLFWFCIVSMQCRCMPPHDGSDTYLRHLLLWSIFLPMTQVWSLDSYLQINKINENKTHHLKNEKEEINKVAVWGLRCQIVLMYLGTVFHRTIDVDGTSFFFNQNNDNHWWGPQWTSVYYILHSSFAIRQNWLGNIIRLHHSPLTQIMTASAMMCETLLPILCLFLPNSHTPSFLLIFFHLNLLAVMNLPNWQLVAMISHTLWIPSSAWDSILQYQLRKYTSTSSRIHTLNFYSWLFTTHHNHNFNNENNSTTGLQKKDLLEKNAENITVVTKKKSFSSSNKKAVSIFLFVYMFYDFGGNRGWYTKLDHGDIGEFMRFSQYWVMYNSPPISSSSILFLGTLKQNTGTSTTITKNVNVWKWIRNPNKIETLSLKTISNPQEWVHGMTHVYPSPRWERAIHGWIHNQQKLSFFLERFCLQSTNFIELTLIRSNYRINSPDKSQRFQYHNNPNDTITMNCQNTNTMK